jgi:hypothetical protein
MCKFRKAKWEAEAGGLLPRLHRSSGGQTLANLQHVDGFDYVVASMRTAETPEAGWAKFRGRKSD